MSIAGHALAAAGIAASALAALTLLLAARRRAGRGRLAYLWFSGAAALWCLGVIAQQALGAPLSGAAVGLTLADLPSLLALIAVVAGVAVLVAAGGGKAGDGWRTLGQRMASRPVIPRLADGFVLAAVLFVIGWIALFGPDYIRSGSGPGAFAVQLLHPMAGLVAAALILPMISDAGAAAVPPFVAVLLVTAVEVACLFTLHGVALPGPLVWARAMAVELGRTLLWTYFYAIFLYALLSLIAPGGYSPLQSVLAAVCEPVLRPIRRLIPSVAGLDLSPLWAIIVIQALLILLR